MVNRSDDLSYALAVAATISGPAVEIGGGEYALFVDTTTNNGTIALQVKSPSGVWVDVQNWGRQFVRITEYTACLCGLSLAAGWYRIKVDGLVLNLNAHLVGAG